MSSDGELEDDHFKEQVVNFEENDDQEEEEQEANESDEEFAGFDDEEIKQDVAKTSKILSDDEDDLRNHDETGIEQEQTIENDEQQESEVQEDEDAQQVATTKPKHVQQKKKRIKHPEAQEEKPIFKKKSRRRDQDSEAITNCDNMIANLIAEMKAAAAEDRAANEHNEPALRKIKMLPLVTNILVKSDLHSTMMELGMLSAIAEWLAPLPDRSLPNIKMREELINVLQEFGEINVDYLKSSGIGKAVMFLYKHSRETKSNREKLEKLIHNWSRPIFSLDNNFKGLSKEERQQRDMEHMRGAHKRSQSEADTQDKAKKKKASSTIDLEEASNLRPGDTGFVPRARVPVLSTKDYIIRPKSNIDGLDLSDKKTKKVESRFDKQKRRFVEIKRANKSTKAVNMSIEGRNM